MKVPSPSASVLIGLFIIVVGGGCSSPSLMKLAGVLDKADDFAGKSSISDLDIVNFTNVVQINLTDRFNNRFVSKAHARAYEDAIRMVNTARASYYLRQLRGSTISEKGKGQNGPTNPTTNSKIPSKTVLTRNGASLYHRVIKILTVLDDALSGGIPSVKDLNEANGTANEIQR